MWCARRVRARAVRRRLVELDGRLGRGALPSRPRAEAGGGAGSLLDPRRRRVLGREPASRLCLPGVARCSGPRRPPGGRRPHTRRAEARRLARPAGARARIRGRRGAVRLLGRRRGHGGRPGRDRGLPGRRHGCVRAACATRRGGTSSARAGGSLPRIRVCAERTPRRARHDRGSRSRSRRRAPDLRRPRVRPACRLRGRTLGVRRRGTSRRAEDRGGSCGGARPRRPLRARGSHR